MSFATTLEINTKSLNDSLAVAEKLGRYLKGGEVIELVGDLGSGKTAFVKGLARGIQSTDVVQSPTFTISRVYRGNDKLEIHHYDFHRLKTPGIVRAELAESLENPRAITVVEWPDTVADILPTERLQIIITAPADEERKFQVKAAGKYIAMIEQLQ